MVLKSEFTKSWQCVWLTFVDRLCGIRFLWVWVGTDTSAATSQIVIDLAFELVFQDHVTADQVSDCVQHVGGNFVKEAIESLTVRKEVLEKLTEFPVDHWREIFTSIENVGFGEGFKAQVLHLVASDLTSCVEIVQELVPASEQSVSVVHACGKSMSETVGVEIRCETLATRQNTFLQLTVSSEVPSELAHCSRTLYFDH